MHPRSFELGELMRGLPGRFHQGQKAKPSHKVRIYGCNLTPFAKAASHAKQTNGEGCKTGGDHLWDAIGAVGEILGALAVFASLMYLARQIGLTRKQFSQQVEDEIQTKIFAGHDPMYQGGMMEIMYKGQHQPDDLTDVEKYAFDLLMGRHLAVMNQIAYRVESGALSSEVGTEYAEFYDQTYFKTLGGHKWAESNGVCDAIERMKGSN